MGYALRRAGSRPRLPGDVPEDAHTLMKTMVLPEGLRRGRQLLQAACARPSALRSPKQAVKTYCRRTYEFNTYSLKYSFITHLLRLSHSPSIVAKIMGHRSLDHILHYTKVKVAEEVLAGLRRA